MLDATFVTELAERMSKPEVLEIDGRSYSTEKLYKIDEYPRTNGFRVSTLQSLADYVNDAKDPLLGNTFIVVQSTGNAAVFRHTETNEKNRLVLADAVSDFSGSLDNSNHFISQTEMMRWLQTGFVQGENGGDIDQLMALFGNISFEHEAQQEDNGRDQNVTVRKGHKFEIVGCPNIVTLRPFRTFQEIEQPTAQFLTRVENGTLALFEVEDLMWKSKARASIKDFLSKALGGEYLILA